MSLSLPTPTDRAAFRLGHPAPDAPLVADDGELHPLSKSGPKEAGCSSGSRPEVSPPPRSPGESGWASRARR
jgi:hypothetical protein